MFKKFKELFQFLKNVAQDDRIPARDKKVLLALIALVISPVDLIPDWIPVIGVMDDMVIMALILDYFFNHLDEEILLAHYPWGPKSFTQLRGLARWIAKMTPEFIKDKIWKA